ncbi:hypothetical protein [Mycolicibacterium farcinogenes]|uniref:hypothetical protein n=1 Tax=Mycolicibacterium farcinogenes TaxID=1802 RepID=UPI001FD5BD01|nr:hypothetical protein [Mycolicibacterium farcinogenes]
MLNTGGAVVVLAGGGGAASSVLTTVPDAHPASAETAAPKIALRTRQAFTTQDPSQSTGRFGR